MSAPSFQFYPDRWFGGTAHLSLAAKGAYIDLLGWQWLNEKPLPLAESARCRITRCTSLVEFQTVWLEIADKFVVTEAGYQNAPLERGRGESEKFREAQAKRAREMWEKKKSRAGAGHEPGMKPVSMPGDALDLDLDLDLSSRSSDLDLGGENGDPGISKNGSHPRADHARANGNGHEPKWTKPTNGRPIGLVGNHLRCYMSPACGRGLCVPSHLVGKWALQISPTDPSAADPQLKAFVDEVLSATPDGPVGDDLIDFWRNHWAQKHGIKTKAPSKFETKTEKIQKSREEAMKLIRAHAAEKTSRPYGRRS